jgi:hypothetical protein
MSPIAPDEINYESSVAVLYQEGPRCEWEFVAYCPTPEEGWKFAAAIKQTERFVLMNKKAKTMVVKRKNFDQGKIKEIKPPSGFNPGLPPDKEVEAYAKNKIKEDTKMEASSQETKDAVS